MFISVSFYVSLFSNKSENFLNTFSHSHWLFLADCFLPVVSLNFFIQSIPSKGVISVFMIIRNSMFCLLFSHSMSTEIYPRKFISFFFTSWYLFVIFCIPVCFNIFPFGGIIVIGDPVSIMISFFFPFIFTVAI